MKVMLLLVVLVIRAGEVLSCKEDKECDEGECCFFDRNQPNSDNRCVPSIFCNKQLGGGFCLDSKECYSDCCVDKQCRTAKFCFDRYKAPIIDGATICVFLLFLCIFSCCCACRLSDEQKKLQQKIYLTKYRLAQLLPPKDTVEQPIKVDLVTIQENTANRRLNANTEGNSNIQVNNNIPV